MAIIWTAERVKCTDSKGNNYIIDNLWKIFRNGEYIGRAFYVYGELYVFNFIEKPISLHIPYIKHAIKKLEATVLNDIDETENGGTKK